MNRYFEANAAFAFFSRKYMELKKNLPIRPSQMGVLNIITKTPGPYTPVMLAEMLDVSKPMISAHLNALTERGYITKEQSETDKRAYYVRPTDKALKLVSDVDIEQNQLLDKLLDALGEDGFADLVALLTKANHVLKDTEK